MRALFRRYGDLADDDTERVRAWVAIALGHFPSAGLIADAETVSVLHRLETDNDAHVRKSAGDVRRRGLQLLETPRDPAPTAVDPMG